MRNYFKMDENKNNYYELKIMVGLAIVGLYIGYVLVKKSTEKNKKPETEEKVIPANTSNINPYQQSIAQYNNNIKEGSPLE